MNIHKMKLYLGALAILIFLPNVSSAYFTTAQSATRLTDDTVLFTVTFKFGFSSRELYMPIMATRGLEATDDSPNAGFKIFNEDNEVSTIGTANALVLTGDEDVEIRDNQYYLPQGRSAEYTLVTLLTIPTELQTANTELFLEMTRLPFTMVDDGKNIDAHLNPSELQYYRTPAISFSKSPVTVTGATHTLTTQ